MLILGIDGGGGSTRAILVDESLRVLGRGVAGPSNYHTSGLDTSRENVIAAVHAALGDHSTVDIAVACLSGVARPADRQRWEAALDGIDWARRVHIDHDARGAWAGALGLEPGIVATFGTGVMVYGETADGRTARADGWGSLIGDEGSGFWIGQQALRAAARAFDGRGPATALVERIIATWELDDLTGTIEQVRTPGVPRDLIAALVPCVVGAAEDGDAVATEILAQAANHLSRGVVAVWRKLFDGQPCKIACVGGIAKIREWIGDPVGRILLSECPGATIVEAAQPADIGAARLGLRLLRGSA